MPTGWPPSATPGRRYGVHDRHAHRRRPEGRRASTCRAGVPMIVLETALPVKFAETIVEAIGREPDRPAGFARAGALPRRMQAGAGRRGSRQGLHREPRMSRADSADRPHAPAGAPDPARGGAGSGGRPPLMSLDDALERLLGAVSALPEIETVDTFDALGRVLADDVRSAIDVPPADNSAMDGYALRAADVPAAGTRLPVSQRIAAGMVGAALAARHGGAHLHRRAGAAGCRRDRHAGAVRRRRRRRRAHRHRARAWRLGAPARTRTSPPAAWCWPAASGSRRRRSGWPRRPALAALRVARRPRVALFSTGDELAMPGEVRCRPGAIYNSNRFVLRGLLQRSAATSPTSASSSTGSTRRATRCAERPKATT